MIKCEAIPFDNHKQKFNIVKSIKRMYKKVKVLTLDNYVVYQYDDGIRQ